ncbi:hypothetical protein IJH29_01050 [Candidatus Saccharibacteria bacterium]|nr:hypothetical protein [Candidatus Saccharibacteria bacterium]
MEFLRQMLLRNGLIANDGSYITDAVCRNQLCVCDKHGYVTHHIERAANGVDLVVRNARTHMVDCRLRLS